MSYLNKKILSSLIATATLGSLAAVPAFAQNNQPAATDSLETVLVTGTRRSDVTALQSSAPIDVISASALIESGASNLGQALAGLLPSFTFPQNTNGAFAQEVPPGASLRGLASDQVLVLVNGKRRHTGSTVTRQNYGAKGGVPVDISLFPIDAIERVEVLRDGASAQYGSDAIAGVINIILKEADEGGKIGFRIGEYKKGDGLSRKLSGWKGFSLPNDGFVTVSLDAGTSAAANDTNPDSRLPDGHPYKNWRFGVGNVQDQYNVLVNSELPLNDNVQAYGFATWSHKISDAEAAYVLPNDRRNLTEIYPQGYWPYTRYTLNDYAINGGLKVENDAGHFDFFVNYGQNQVDSHYYQILNASWGPETPTDFYTGRRTNEQTNIGLDWVKDFTLPFLQNALTVSSGLAWRDEKYTLDVGEAAAWENRWYPHPSGGFYTPASSGITPNDAGVISRDVIGAYLDLETQLTDAWQAGVAFRFEDYSDFGNTSNGKLTTRYDFTPEFALRASFSTGHRAPSLVQAGFQGSGTQFVEVSPGQFTAVQQRTLRADSEIAAALGGKPLEAETSDNISAGLVWRPLERTSITLDAYQIEVKERVTPSENLSGNDVIAALERVGIYNVNSATFFTNLLDTRTRGAELVAKTRLDIAGGQLDINFGYAWNETEITNIRNVGNFSGTRIIGRAAQGVLEDVTPNNKYTLGIAYKIGNWNVNFNNRFYGEYTSRSTAAANDQTFSSQAISDLDIAYRFDSGVRLVVGSSNIFDTRPDKLASTGTGAYGIAKYSTASPEGHQGAFYYSSVSYEF